MCLFWKIELGGRNKQEKQDTKENFLALNSREIKQDKSKLFKGTCQNCGKYGNRASDL